MPPRCSSESGERPRVADGALSLGRAPSPSARPLDGLRLLADPYACYVSLLCALTFAITGARRSCVRPRGLRCPESLRFHADGGDPSLSEHAFLLLTPVAENRCRSNFGKTRCCEILPELSASTHVAAGLGLQCHVCLDGARQFRRRRRQNESAPVGTTHANDTSGFQDSAKLAQRR